MIRKYRLLCTALVICLFIQVVSLPVGAYGHFGSEGGTHRLVNALALRKFITEIAARDAVFAHYDFYPQAAKYGLAQGEGHLFQVAGATVIESGWFTDKEDVREHPFAWWIMEGGYTADAPEIRMGLRHFYDPMRQNGVTYLTDTLGPLFSPPIDAPTWALRASPHALGRGVEDLSRAFTVLDPERRRELYAAAWRSLGETMHVLADLTVPAHTRNDGHPLRDPYEDSVDGQWIETFLQDARSDWRVSEVLTDAIADCHAPEELFRLVASYTNAGFFSNDTISGRDPATGKMLYNRNHQAGYAQPRMEDCQYDQITGFYTATDFKGTLLAAASQKHGRPIITKACAYSQAQRLIPAAVAANAGLLALCLPRVEVLVEAYDAPSATIRGRIIIHGRQGSQASVFTGLVMMVGDGAGERSSVSVLTPIITDGEGKFAIAGFPMVQSCRAFSVGIDMGGILVRSNDWPARGNGSCAAANP